MDEEQELVLCYEQLYQRMVAKDTALLEKILADDFVLLHMTGMRQSKAEFIRSIKTGQLQYFSAQTHQVQILERTRESAILLGQSLVLAAVFGGGKHQWRLQLKLRLRKTQLCWRIVEAAASTY